MSYIIKALHCLKFNYTKLSELCFGSNYTELSLDDPDNMSNTNYQEYNDLVIENSNNNYRIYHLFKEQDYRNLSKIDTRSILDVVDKLTPNDFIKLKLSEDFIINLYEQINSKKDNQELNSIVSRLVTLYLFFEFNNTTKIINFLTKKRDLFDTLLWVSLILDPIYGEDGYRILITSQLAYNQILPIYRPIKYLNLEYTIFEYILLGKMTIKNDGKAFLCYNRFFELGPIIKFISQFNTNIYPHERIINTLHNMMNYNMIDHFYIITVINTLEKSNYLFSTTK